MPRVIVVSTQRTRLHPIDVEYAVQVIDLMLKDSGVPAGCVNRHGLRLFIQAFDSHLPGARDNRGETRDTQTALKEFGNLEVRKIQFRIDQHMERHRPALAFGRVFLGQLLDELGLVFDHHNLHGKPNLRSRQTHAWSVASAILIRNVLCADSLATTLAVTDGTRKRRNNHTLLDRFYGVFVLTPSGGHYFLSPIRKAESYRHGPARPSIPCDTGLLNDLCSKSSNHAGFGKRGYPQIHSLRGDDSMDLDWSTISLTALANAGLTAAIFGIWKPWLGAYGGEKGKNLARKEDLTEILAEVRAVTITQKEIETKLAGDLWRKQNVSSAFAS